MKGKKEERLKDRCIGAGGGTSPSPRYKSRHMDGPGPSTRHSEDMKPPARRQSQECFKFAADFT